MLIPNTKKNASNSWSRLLGPLLVKTYQPARRPNLEFPSLCAKGSLILSATLRAVLIFSVLVLSAGCSFRSVQWEGIKTLKSLAFKNSEDRREVYWWKLVDEEATYRLFPVEWSGSTILTDGNRWFIVVPGAELSLIRDVQLDEEISIQYSINAQDIQRNLDLQEKRDPLSNMKVNLVGGSPEWTRVTRRSITSNASIDSKTVACRPASLKAAVRLVIRNCLDENREFEMSVATLNQSGSISELSLNVPGIKRLKMIQTSELVDEEALSAYLLGEINVSQ